jgi:hypothetical protein
MKIKYRDKDLLETQTFITFGSGETEITLEDETDESLSLILNFVDHEDKDHEGKEPDIHWEVINDHKAKLNLINFSDQLGRGLKEPIYIGSFAKRKLYVLFYTNITGAVKNCRVVTISFYLGEEVQDGQD